MKTVKNNIKLKESTYSRIMMDVNTKKRDFLMKVGHEFGMRGFNRKSTCRNLFNRKDLNALD